MHGKHQWNEVFSNSRSGWNFNYKYFCSSKGETLSDLAKDVSEGNNCGKTECEHSTSCQKRNPWGKERMKVNSQSFYWISSSIVLHGEMNSSKAWNNFWSGIWICFFSSMMLQITYNFYVMLISCTSLTNNLVSITVTIINDFIIFKFFVNQLALTNYVKNPNFFYSLSGAWNAQQVNKSKIFLNLWHCKNWLRPKC